MSAFLIGMLLAAGASTAADESSKVRLLNGKSLVTADDYPLESLRNEETGSVRVRLTVSGSGEVTDCTVIESSGHAALDERTCAIYSERAKFEPARDRRGRPMEATWTQTTKWQLAAAPQPAMPRTAWMMRYTIAVDRDGNAVGCTIDSEGVPNIPPVCTASAEVKGTAASDRTAAGFAISEISFYPVDPDSAPVTPPLEDAQLVAKQISRITITPDGQIIACEGVLYSGKASPKNDACNSAGQPRFEAAPGGSGPQTATLVQVGFSRGAVAVTEEKAKTPADR